MMTERGGILARLRRDAGYTQQTFVHEFVVEAAALRVSAALSVRQLRRYENENPPPLPHTNQQAVLESILGIPLEEMGFDVPAHRRTMSGPLGNDHDGAQVKRRRLVADLGGLTSGMLTQPAGDLTGPGRIGAGEVKAMRQKAAELFQLDHALGGAKARLQARRLIRQIEYTLATGTYLERVGRQLQTVLGEVNSHLGWLAHDAGRADEARAAVLEALAAARLVDDDGLAISALESMCLLAIDQDRPWEAAAAVESAQFLAENHAGPTVRMVLALREAGAAMSGGDLSRGRRALSRAMSLHGRAVEEDDAPRWARFAGPVEIDYATGSYYLKAGHPAAAVPFVRAAVDGLAAGYARNSALYRARLAGVLLRAGDVEAACDEAAKVLDVSSGLSSARLAGRLKAFAVQAGRTDSAAARQYVARFRAALEDQNA